MIGPRVGCVGGVSARPSVGVGADAIYRGGYPTTAAEMRAACGDLGTWTAGWLCDEASGNLAAAFGGITLTAANTPLYGIAGPRGGSDKAIGLDSTNDGFAAAAAAALDVDETEDLILAAIIRYPSAPTTAAPVVMAKNTFGGTEGNYNFNINANGGVRFDVRDDAAAGNTRIVLDTSTNMATSQWHAIVAALSRTASRMRCGFRSLSTGVTAVSLSADCSAIGSLANATAAFRLGVSSYPVQVDVAAAYVGVGVGFADQTTDALSGMLYGLASVVMA